MFAVSLLVKDKRHTRFVLVLICAAGLLRLSLCAAHALFCTLRGGPRVLRGQLV